MPYWQMVSDNGYSQHNKMRNAIYQHISTFDTEKKLVMSVDNYEILCNCY